jgi:Protein of unknown function (DUF2505)
LAIKRTFFITRVFSAPVEFELRHHFEASTQVVARTILDQSYQESLDPIGPLKSRKLLSQQDNQGIVVRKVRCVLDVDFAGAARRILGSADPAWVEESTWFPNRMAWEWKVIPEVAASILSANGEMTLLASDGATDRVVAGDVKVHVPIFGGGVERAIVEGVTKVYDEEAERLTRWLANTDPVPSSGVD